MTKGTAQDEPPLNDAGPDDDESVKELFGRLIDDSTDLVRAEIDHRRLLAARRIDEARPFIAMGAMGIGIALSGMIATIILLGLSLAAYMPLPVAALVTALLALLAGYILTRRAWLNVTALFAQARAEFSGVEEDRLP
jgi:hypothetical protein